MNSTPRYDVLLQSAPIDINACIGQVMSPSCGGIDVFIGTVRNATKGKTVTHLEFEAYEAMAVSEIKKIAEEAIEKWPVETVVIRHRTGRLEIGEVPVVIAVAAAHRDAAFDACRFIIDTLKQTVPIWKKEFFEDGAQWVSAHP